MWDRIADNVAFILPMFLVFGGLAVVTKKSALWQDIRAARKEISKTVCFYIVDIIFVAPITAVLAAWPAISFGASLATSQFWVGTSPWLVVLTAVVLGDYIGYWRHKISHSKFFWPIHIAHHSDRALNWFSTFRIHPFERFVIITVDSTVLALLGFPFWAIVGNNLVRSFWGYFIHADLPWNLGPIGRLLITPSAHRWHHVREEAFSGQNFAQVFTVWDRIHGTYYDESGPCQRPTGVENHELGFVAEMFFPLKAFVHRMKRLKCSPPCASKPDVVER